MFDIYCFVHRFLLHYHFSKPMLFKHDYNICRNFTKIFNTSNFNFLIVSNIQFYNIIYIIFFLLILSDNPSKYSVLQISSPGFYITTTLSPQCTDLIPKDTSCLNTFWKLLFLLHSKTFFPKKVQKPHLT